MYNAYNKTQATILYILYSAIIFFFVGISTLAYTQMPSGVVVLAHPTTSYQSLNSKPQTCPDGENGLIAIYRSKRNNESFDLLYYQRLTFQGDKIPTADGIAIAPSAFNQHDHQIATDNKKGVFVVWQEKRNSEKYDQLYAQHVNQKGESQWLLKGIPVALTENEQSNPRIIADGEGGAIIFWNEQRHAQNGKDIYAQRINAKGKLIWGKHGKPIARMKGEQQNFHITHGRNKMFFIVWEDYRVHKGWRILAQKIDLNGETKWTDDGIIISLKEKMNCKNPNVCADGGGGFFCVYQAVGSESHQQDIFLSRVSPYNDILYHKTICEASEEQSQARVVLDNDKVIVYWRDYRNGNGDIYGQKLNFVMGTQNWEDNGKLICSGLTEQTEPLIITTPDTLVRWMFYQNKIYNKNIFANKLNARTYETSLENTIPLISLNGDQYDFQVFVDDQKKGMWLTWVDEQMVDFNTIRSQYIDFNGVKKFDEKRAGIDLLGDHKSIYVAVDNPVWQKGKHNDYYVAWDDYRNGTKNSDIYLQRLDSLGNPLWRTEGIPICGALGEQSQPKIFPTHKGVFIAWADRRDNDDDIYIQFVDTNGFVQWQVQGIPLVQQPNTQNSLQWCLLDNEHLLLTWTDARAFYEQGFDIYFQMIDQKGNQYLRMNGNIIEKDPTYQSSSVVCSDQKNGAYLFWMDERNGPYQIYGQHLNTYCKKLWGNSGIRLCSSISHQRFPSIAPTTDGQVFVAWNDDRFGTLLTKAYIQKLDSVGKSLFSECGVAVCGAIGRQSSVSLLPDDYEGCVVAWLNQRNEDTNNHELYVQRIREDGVKMWDKDGVEMGGNLTSNNLYHMTLGNNCNVLICWSQVFSKKSTKAFWGELDLDTGNLLKLSIVDVEDNTHLKPQIYQFSDLTIGVLWLSKTIYPFTDTLKLSLFR